MPIGDKVPDCFTKEQWIEWNRLNNRVLSNQRANTPCQDCTVEYKHKMTKEGRCTHPNTVFFHTITRSLGTVELEYMGKTPATEQLPKVLDYYKKHKRLIGI